MKKIPSFASAVLVCLTAGCAGAAAGTSAEPAVPVAVAPTAPEAPVAPLAPAAVQVSQAAYATTSATTTTVATGSVATASVQPLDQLVAPIALYPDPLLALLLPASTVSSDVVLAARYLAGGGDPQQVDAQGWDESVRGLAHYPEVIKWMDENLAWTQQLGAAYLDSAENVMAAVQRVRAEAKAKGLLATTPQQQVVLEGSTIEIVPAQPDVIYVPRYDPEIIFVDHPVIYATDPWLTFGIGFSVGWWLSYDFDWHYHRIWVDRQSRDHWRDRHDWRQPIFVGGGGQPRPGYEAWHPAPNRSRPGHRDFDNVKKPQPRPTPMEGAPHRNIPGRGNTDRHNGDLRRESPQRPVVGQPTTQPPTAIRHLRPVDSAGRVVTPTPAPSAHPVTETPRNGEAGNIRRDQPQERPRIGQQPTGETQKVDRAAPSRPVSTPAPTTEQRRQPVSPDTRTSTPATPRESRGDVRTDRNSRPEAAPRVAPQPQAQAQKSKSDDASRSRGDRDDSRQPEK